MLYSEYKAKIAKIIATLTKLKRYRVLILSVAFLIVALIAAFLGTKGIILDSGSCPGEITYGDSLSISAKALFSSVEYQYAPEGGAWQDSFPTAPGTYRVRAVSNAAFGGSRYGDAHTFTLLPRTVELHLASSSVTYGDYPTLTGDLSQGDRVVCEDFTYGNPYASETTVLPTLESVQILNNRGQDVTTCYTFSVQEEAITIGKRTLVLSVTPYSAVYNGMAHSSSDYTVSQGSLAWDDQLSLEFFQYLVFVGSVENTPTVSLTDSVGHDISMHYALTVVPANITITPRPLLLNASAENLVYDGIAHQSTAYTVDPSTPLLAGHEIRVEGATSVTNAGTYDNRLTLTILSGGENVSGCFTVSYTPDSTITVEQREFFVFTGYQSKTYDGTALTATITDVVGLVEGHYVEILSAASITNVAENATATVTVAVKGPEGDVSDNYLPSYDYGTLTVLIRHITLNVSGASKVFDGTPLTASDCTFGGEGLPAGHTYLFHPETYITYVGESGAEGRGTVTIWKDGNDVSSNFAIDNPTYGTLTVTKRPIKVYSHDVTKVYDATLLTGTEHVTVELAQDLSYEGGLLPGHEAVIDFATFNLVDVTPLDGVQNLFDVTIWANGVDITENYDRDLDFGTLKITPRPIILSSQTVEKVYDNVTLTADMVYYTMLGEDVGLLNFHYIETTGFISFLDAFASRREDVVPVANTFSATIHARDELRTDVSHNYAITYDFGEIAVYPRPITITSGSVEKVYDGLGVSAGVIDPTAPPAPDTGLLPGHHVEASGFITYLDAFAPKRADVTPVANTFSAGVFVDGGGDISYNYEITLDFGTIAIYPRPLTVTSESVYKVYDGISFTPSGITYAQETTHPALTDAGLLSIHTLSVGGFVTYEDAFAPKRKDVTPVANTFSAAVKVKHDETVDVSHNYEITLDFGEVAVYPRPMTLASQSVNKTYDGISVTADAVQQKEPLDGAAEGLLEIHTLLTSGFITYLDAFAPKRADVTPVANTFSAAVKLKDDEAVDVTHNYEITLDFGSIAIYPRLLSVESASGTHLYDDTFFSVETYNIIIEKNEEYDSVVGEDNTYGLLPIHTHEGYNFTEVRDVVKKAKNDFLIRIFDGTGDVTHNYEIEYLYGELTVTPRPLTVTTHDGEKYFDGINLTQSGHTAQITTTETPYEGLIAGHTTMAIEETLTAILNVWESGVENIFQVSISADEGTRDVTGNYAISYVWGTLQVYPREITIEVANAEKEFDGTPLTSDLVEMVGGMGLPAGYTLTITTDGWIRLVGTTTNNLLSWNVICDSDPENARVMENFTLLEALGGTLTITVRDLTVTAKDAEKTYDGTPLYAPQEIVEDINALLETEGFTWTVVVGGSQTQVGTSSAVIAQIQIWHTYDSVTEDVTHCFDITKEDGVLRVGKERLVIHLFNLSKEYDGTPLYYKDGYWYILPADRPNNYDAFQVQISLAGYGLTEAGELDMEELLEAMIASGDLIIYEKDGQGGLVNVTDSFLIELVGKCTIEKRELVLTADSASKVFDGKPLTLTNNDYSITLGELLAGHTIESIAVYGEAQAANTEMESYIDPDSIVIVDTDGNDVTDNYSITCLKGLITILPDNSQNN